MSKNENEGQRNKKRGLPQWCALAMSAIQSQIPCPTPWVCYHMILTQPSSHLEWWHTWQPVNFIVNNNFWVVMMSENTNKVQETKREDYLPGVPLQCQQFNPRFCVPHLECFITWSWHNFLPISSGGTCENLCVSLSTIIFEFWWWVIMRKKYKEQRRGLPYRCALAV